jgi:hypothetical protein
MPSTDRSRACSWMIQRSVPISVGPGSRFIPQGEPRALTRPPGCAEPGRHPATPPRSEPRETGRYRLLAVGADQPVDELIDGAGLGQTTLGQLIGQLDLGQPLVPFPGLLPLLPGGGPLGPLGLEFLFPGGFLRAGGLLLGQFLRLAGRAGGQVPPGSAVTWAIG